MQQANSQEDSLYLYNEMKKSGLPIDYLFVMPYYDYIDRQKGNFLAEIVVTKGEI